MPLDQDGPDIRKKYPDPDIRKVPGFGFLEKLQDNRKAYKFFVSLFVCVFVDTRFIVSVVVCVFIFRLTNG